MKGQTAPQKISPELLLSGVENQGRKVSYEQAIGASAQFVSKLIESGRLMTIKEAAHALVEGVSLIQPTIQKELVAIQMKEIEAYLQQGSPEAPKA